MSKSTVLIMFLLATNMCFAVLFGILRAELKEVKWWVKTLKGREDRRISKLEESFAKLKKPSVTVRYQSESDSFSWPRAERQQAKEFEISGYMRNPNRSLIERYRERETGERTQGILGRLGNPASSSPFVTNNSTEVDPEAALDALVGTQKKPLF